MMIKIDMVTRFTLAQRDAEWPVSRVRFTNV
jgi:hypothetical protein